jgi:hypothetical protein
VDDAAVRDFGVIRHEICVGVRVKVVEPMTLQTWEGTTTRDSASRSRTGSPPSLRSRRRTTFATIAQGLRRSGSVPDGTDVSTAAVHRAEGCKQALLPRSRPTVRKLPSEATFRLPGPSPRRLCSAGAIFPAVPFALQSTVFRVPIFRVL